MPRDGWYPEATKLPITTREFYSTRAAPLVSIVNHITDGTDSRDFLQNTPNDSSVHFLIREEGGKGVVYQFMPVERAAWGNGRYSNDNPNMPTWVKRLIAQGVNINHATVSIEHERKWPFTTTLPATMLAASIELHKWLISTYPTIQANREHIIGHYQIDHISRAHCPGGAGGTLFPFDTIIDALQSVTQTTVVVKPALQEYAETHPGIGLPLWNAERELVLEDGRRYQCMLYERALLHWRAGESVGEARLGWMFQNAIEALKAG